MDRIDAEIPVRCPSRRKYHDVNISSLLHIKHVGAGKRPPDAQQQASSYQSKSKKEVQPARMGILTSLPSEQTNRHLTGGKIRNFLEEEVFQNHNNNITSDSDTSDHHHAYHGKKKAKVRKKPRRHTVATSSSIKLDEIEKWIADSKLHDASNVDECCIPETKITRTKLAENKTNYIFSGLVGNERRMQRSGERRRRSSCGDLSRNNNAICDVIQGALNVRHRSVQSVEAKTKTSSFGLNRRHTCFLTPRPYGKSWDSTAYRMASISESRATTNGDCDVIKDKVQQTNGRILEDSDEDLVSAAGMPFKSKNERCNGGSVYDTFLDLSKLPCDDVGVEKQLATSTSGTCAVTRTSTISDIDERPNSCEDIQDVVSDLTYSIIDQVERNILNENINSNNVLPTQGEVNTQQVATPCVLGTCSPVTVSEETRPECDHNVDRSSRNDDTGVTVTTKPTNLFCEDTVEDKQGEAAGKTNGDCGDNVNYNDDVKVCAGASNAAGQGSDNEVDTRSVNSSSTGEIPDKTTLKLNLDFPTDKTMSLDRNSFSSPDIGLLHNLVTKEKGCRCNGEKSELPYGNSAETNADNAVVRSGLKRLFQIAVSTVDGQRRPGAKIKDVLDLLESKGIRLSDPRMRETFRRIDAEPKGAESELTIETFSRICSPSFHFIRGVLLSQLTIPGMSIFKLRMERIFDKIKKILQQQPHQPTGSIDPFSNYNVMMRRRKSNHTVSLALCTVDGQRLSFGDKETPHPLNACATMFNYCLAHAQNGPEVMLHYLGKEPKPEDKGELTFNSDGKVWNPLTKSGAFMTSCLVFREMAVEERLDALHAFYDSLSGHEPLCCDNLSYNFKRSYAHEVIGAAYNLSSTQRLPRGTSEFIAEALDFHFQSSSTAMTSDACAVSAATLANNGICPLTGRVVVQQSSVEATLHTMRTCEPDIHAQAGERLQGVAGGWSENGSIMLVVPGVVGITCFTHCQSLHTIKQVVRCLFEELNINFNFMVYRSLKDRGNMMFRR